MPNTCPICKGSRRLWRSVPRSWWQILLRRPAAVEELCPECSGIGVIKSSRSEAPEPSQRRQPPHEAKDRTPAASPEVEKQLEILESGGDDAREKAIKALAELGPAARSAVPRIVEAIEEDALCWAATSALGQIGGKEAIQALCNALLTDRDAGVRMRAAGSLGSIGDPVAVPSLIQALRHPAEYVRASAVDSLGMLGDTTVEPAVRSVQNDSSAFVRSAAAEALERLSEKTNKSASAGTSIDTIRHEEGLFVDQRDGKQYKTITFGRCVVMAENFAYEPRSGSYWAYNDDQSNVARYGYLYSLEASRTIAPSGWRLPTRKDWEDLFHYEAANHLPGPERRELIQRDFDTFNPLFAGFRYKDGTFKNLGVSAFFWEIAPPGFGYASTRDFAPGDRRMGSSGGGPETRAYGCSIRLMKDE